MSVLVTGASGFIGSRLVTRLEGAGYSVEEFDVLIESSQTVADYEVLKEAFERNEYVFHLAAVADVWEDDKTELFNSNIIGVRNVTKASEETQTPVLFTSSVTARNPTNLYAETKKIGEDICRCSEGDLSWVQLTNVVGAGTQKGQVAAMIEQAVTEEEIEVWGNGEIERSYVSVETVCEQLLDCFESGQTGFCGEVGSRTMTNYTMASIIVSTLDSFVSIQRVEKMPPSPKTLTASTVTDEEVQSAVRSQVDWFQNKSRRGE